jgi:serine protease Do
MRLHPLLLSEAYLLHTRIRIASYRQTFTVLEKKRTMIKRPYWKPTLILLFGCLSWASGQQLTDLDPPDLEGSPAGVVAGVRAGNVVDAISSDPLEELRDRQASIQRVFKRVSPSVVALGSADRRKQGWGSGVIVSEDGLILTAGHVTEATGDQILVYLEDGREMVGQRLGANMNRDAAMVQLIPTNEDEKFPYVEVAEADTAELGDWVVAMGHPGGYDPTRPAPLRLGRVLQKQSDKLLVTDCTLAGGDSGGALFDLQGRLIGINSSIAQSLSHNMHVAMAVFHRGWDRMKAGGENGTWGELKNLFDEPLPGYESKIDKSGNRALLGAKLDKRSRNGVLVRDVPPGYPAAEGGLRPGDVIIGFDGESVGDYTQLFPLLSKMEPGDQVEILVSRRGQIETVVVTMGDRAKLLDQQAR